MKETWRWLYTLIWLGWRCRCPKCGQGKMFASHFQIHQKCPACEVVLQPYAGDSLGVYAVAYFVTLIPTALCLAASYWLFHPSPYGYLAIFAVSSGLFLFGCYPNMKSLWIAFVYLLTGLRKRL